MRLKLTFYLFTLRAMTVLAVLVCIGVSVSVHGFWEEWTVWSECSSSCENGTQNRNRSCVEPLHGGDDCEGDATEVKDCFLIFCPGSAIASGNISHFRLGFRRIFQCSNHDASFPDVIVPAFLVYKCCWLA